MNFAEEIDLLIRARYPIIYVMTHEEERVEQTLAELTDQRKVYFWDFVEGYQQQGADRNAGRNNPLQALEFVERSPDHQPAIFVLRDYHRFLEDIAIGRKLRNLSRRLRSVPKTIVLIAPRLNIPPDLAEDLTVLEFDLPNFEQLSAEIRRLLPATSLGVVQFEELVKACQGLTLNRVRQVLAKALAKHGTLEPQDLDLILEEKRQKIRQTQILDFYPTSAEMSDIGGLDNLKDWLMRRGGAFSEQARRYGLPAPRGLLLVGVQGTGKSLSAKAIAHHWHLPLLRLDVGRLFAGLVGESESRTRQMIQLAEALSPCVLWLDEMDKAFGATDRAGDAGTASRVFATFLTWMGEKTAPVFMVATANDIDRLPPELLRKGRFDEVFFVGLPSQQERREIFQVHLNKLRPQQLRAFDLDRLAYETPDFSGAEIEQSLVDAMHTAFSEQRDFATQDIIEAVSQMIPLALTAQEQIQKLQEWAKSGKARLASRQQGSFMQQTNRPSSF
ncbi:AAA family ATPase [Anthocerotibacter panamensis]|uniref:AAA family ATPase n=1 Tax=Anthocerotibacter panamensis TaxID=2857077 RepID=UPI001C404129|nr:AAA family ATPase [Anthocerotibacter panamensis]